MGVRFCQPVILRYNNGLIAVVCHQNVMTHAVSAAETTHGVFTTLFINSKISKTFGGRKLLGILAT